MARLPAIHGFSTYLSNFHHYVSILSFIRLKPIWFDAKSVVALPPSRSTRSHSTSIVLSNFWYFQRTCFEWQPCVSSGCHSGIPDSSLSVLCVECSVYGYSCCGLDHLVPGTQRREMSNSPSVSLYTLYPKWWLGN